MKVADIEAAVTSPLIVGLGGGVNSTAMLVGMYAFGVRPDLISFADTGSEKPETYDHVANLDAWLLSVGFPAVTWVKKRSPRVGDASLEAECLRRETMPSRAFGLSSCAHRWKIEPQERFLNHWPPARAAWARGDKPTKALGIDAGETRRKRPSEDAKLRYSYPLVEWGWDRDACIDAIRGAGLAVPVKSACFFCPSSKQPEILALAAEHPDLLARAIKMESVALASDRHDLRTVHGLGRHWAWGDLINMAEEKRRLLPMAPVESCMICDDGDEDAE